MSFVTDGCELGARSVSSNEASCLVAVWRGGKVDHGKKLGANSATFQLAAMCQCVSRWKQLCSQWKPPLRFGMLDLARTDTIHTPKQSNLGNLFNYSIIPI